MKKLETVSSIAETLGITKARVYELIRLNILPAVHLGRQIRIDLDTFQEWIRNGGCTYSKKNLNQPSLRKGKVYE